MNDEFRGAPSRLGPAFPGAVGISVPEPYRRIEYRVGYDEPLPSGVNVLVFGRSTPPDVVKACLRHSAAAVVAFRGEPHYDAGFKAAPFVVWRDYVGATLCRS